MASSSVLKEFLVRIGFAVNDTQYRNFQEGMNRIAKGSVELAKNFVKLGEASTLAITAMGAGMVVAGKQMEGMYFAAQRTGASAKELDVFSFAAEQVGINADTARQAIEKMAGARRTNPGLNGILGGLGIDPRQMDNAKVMVELITKLRNMDAKSGNATHFVTSQWAAMFGLDEQSFTQIEKNFPAWVQMMQKREQMLAASGRDEAKESAQSLKFIQKYNEMNRAVGDFAQTLQTRMMPIGMTVMGWFKDLAAYLEKADKSTGGLSTRVIGLAGALLTLASSLRFLANISGLSGLVKLLGSGVVKLLGRGGAIAGEGAVAAEGAGGAAAAAGGGALAITGGLVAAAIALAGIVFSRGLAEKVTGWLGLDPKGHAAWDAITGVAQKTKTAVVPYLTDMVKHFEGFRAQAYQDISGHATAFFGHKLAPGESIAGRDPNQVLQSDLATAILAVHRYVKTKLTHNQESALADFVFNVGAKKFADSTLLRKLNGGDYAGAANQFQYWNHALVDGHMTTVKALTARRSAEANMFRNPDRPISIQQKTDYHINSTDPQGAASEVARRQGRLNSDMVRNLAGTVK
jgi:GH24 family phage-related lysozyme (muramidase)